MILIDATQSAGWWDHLERISDVALVVGPVAYFFIRWARRIDTMFGATKDVSKVHLPFIYKRLRAHDLALNLEPPDHPNIVFVANGSK